MRSAPDIVDAPPFAALATLFAPRPPARLAASAPLVGRIARFLCVGLVGLAVDTALFALLYPGAAAPLARAASLTLATGVTWALNRAVTFGPSAGPALAELARYCGVALVAQGFNYGLFLSLHFALGETRPFACLFASAAATAAFSFVGQSRFAFRFRRRARGRA